MATKAPKAPKGEQRGFTIDEGAISKPQSMKDVQFAMRRTNTQYTTVLQRIADLKPGQFIEIPVPKETTLKRMKATMSSTIRKRMEDTLNENLRLSFRETAEGNLAICLIDTRKE